MREIHLNNGLKIEIAEDNYLRGVDLQGLDLSGVDLSNTEFIQGKADQCKLNRTNLTNSNLRSCVFKEALIDEVDFSGADLSGSAFFWTLEVHNCDFSGAVMSGVAFHTAVLNSKFIGIENAKLNLFYGALTECDLSGSLEISLIEGSFSNSRFENVLFKNSSFHDSAISGNTSFYDSSANNPYFAQAWVEVSTSISILYQTAWNGPLSTVGATLPVIPAANDVLSGFVIYQAA